MNPPPPTALSDPTTTLFRWNQCINLSSTLIGGKAKQLAQLAQFGFCVPEGLVLSRHFVRQCVDEALWQAAIDAAQSSGAEQISKLSDIQTQFQRCRLPPTLYDILSHHIQQAQWQHTPLAVRSSAPGEDSQTASFAGIHSSVLQVKGMEALTRAIFNVIASLWTAQACAYRDHQGITASDADMAIILMPMVQADIAGVIFTCDPHHGREDQMRINYVQGLADTLVNGDVAGEEIQIQRDWSQIEWKVIKDQTTHKRGPARLSDELALELAQLAMEVANALDYTQPFYDIEWVYDGQRFVIVQARPITAKQLRSPPEIADQGLLWTRGNAKEILPFAVSISETAVMQTAVNEMLTLPHRLVGHTTLEGGQRVSFFHGHAYLSATLIQWEIFQGFDIPPEETNFILGGHQDSIKTSPHTLWKKAGAYTRLLKALIRFPRLRRLGLKQAQTVQATQQNFHAVDLASRSHEDLLQDIEERAKQGYTSRQGMCLMQGASGSLLELRRQLLRLFPQQAEHLCSAIMSGGEASISAQQGYDLIHLAQLAKQDRHARDFLLGHQTGLDLADSEFKSAYQNFLLQYGHRGNYESYLTRPQWRDLPERLHQAILHLQNCDGAALRHRAQDNAQQAWQTIDSGCSFFQRQLLHYLHRQAKEECDQRELARNCFAILLDQARQIMLELGHRLQQAGRIQSADDLFHLSGHERRLAFQGGIPSSALQARVAHRRSLIAQWNRDPSHIPDVIHQHTRPHTMNAEKQNELSEHTPAKKAVQQSWQGIAVSTGRYQGRIRLIHRSDQIDHLQEGEIMLAPHTDPSWLPLFLKASAVIVETGGYLSHSAIVARELGIPTVVNIPHIMRELNDGDLVLLEGELGRISRLS